MTATRQLQVEREAPLRRWPTAAAAVGFVLSCAVVAIGARAYSVSATGFHVSAPVTAGELVPLVALLGTGAASLVIWTLWPHRRRRRSKEDEVVREFPRDPWWTTAVAAATAAALMCAVFVAVALVADHSAQRQTSTRPTGIGHGLPAPPGGGPATGTSGGLSPGWLAVAVTGGVLLFAAAAVAFGAVRSRGRAEDRRQIQTDVVATIADTLEDLERDPDARRAVIGAYARMESTLAAHGLPRRPSEAPLEYLQRVLGRLTISAGATERLTQLFERAKFSLHAIDTRMKTDAVTALTAVRDELGEQR
jgi:hypothetical protein